MTLSQKTIEFLRDIITGDKNLSPYKSGPELVKFFNSIGFNDKYEQGFPSRWYYVETKFNELNEQGRMHEVLYNYFSPINFIGEETSLNKLINLINKYLEFDEYKLELKNKKIKIISIGNEIVKTPEIINIDNEIIKENIEKCGKKISEGDYSGAITNSRTFLETLLLYIYKNIQNQEYSFDGDLPRLYKEVSKLLKLNIKDNTEDDLKRVLGGLISIVSGISGISNKMADRHGRLTKQNEGIEKLIAILVVNSVKVLSLYLYSCYLEILK